VMRQQVPSAAMMQSSGGSRRGVRMMALVAVVWLAGGASAAPNAAALNQVAQQWMDAWGIGSLRTDPPRILRPADATLGAGAPSSLFQAWKAAQVNDPALRAARAAAAAGLERLPQAESQLRPQVQLTAARNRNEVDRQSLDFLGNPQSTMDRYLSVNDTLTFRQPLLREQQRAQRRQAVHAVQESQAQLLREEQALAVRLTGAYLEALLARDQIALIEAQKAFLGTQLRAARLGLEKGTGTRTDVDETQARLDLALAQEVEARQQWDVTRRQLESYVGQPVGELPQMDPARLDLLMQDRSSLEAWVDAAIEASPELLALRAQRDQAREEIARARAGHLPTLDLVAQVQRSRSEIVSSPQTGYLSSSVGFQLTIPLYTGGYISSLERQAAAEYERFVEQLEAARRDLSVRAHREFKGVTEGVPRIRALEVALRSSEVAVDSARKGIVAGTRTVVDVLNAQQQRQQVLRSLAQARYVVVLSRVRLQSLAGQVDQGFMQRVGAPLEGPR
jgi:protease secretion system outer membrane protein